MSKIIGGIVVSILIVGCLVCGILMIIGDIHSAHASYTGTVTFQTVQEYQLFKQALAGTTINDLEVCDVVDPYIVQFHVSVPYDTAFPYGQRSNDLTTDGGIVMLALAIPMLSIMLAVILKEY